MADPVPSSDPTDATVLIVDADAEAAASLARAVERSGDGFVTVVEATLDDAVARVGTDAVDCVVLTDGVTGDAAGVVDGIRERFDGPVVFVAREGSESLAGEVVAAGADEYVPVDADPSEVDASGLGERIRAAVAERATLPLESLFGPLPAGVALVRDGVVAYANARFRHLLAADRDSLDGVSLVDIVLEDDREAVLELLDAAGPTTANADPVSEVVGDGWSGPEVELHALWLPAADAVVVLALDAGERRGRERRLAVLHRTTREMLRSRRADDIADLAAETAVETLGSLAASVYVYDRNDGELRRSATASGLVSVPGGPRTGSRATPDAADDIAWEAFVAGEDRHWRGDAPEDGVGSRLVIPLGDSGVLVVAGASADAFDEADVEFARTLATNVEVALDRAHREATLLDRTDRLRERTETLDRLRRIDAVVRDIGQLLVRATGREEIERAVCERLAAVEGWRLAWIGQRSVAGEGLEPRSYAGDDGFVAAVGAADPEGFLDAPAGTALETGTPQHVPDVVAHPGAGEWREVTLDHGFRSVVSIPLTHEGREYGVLEVYGDGSGAFADAERSVLGELGEMIAYATSAVERERALLADGGPEIEIATGDAESFFARLAASVDARVTVDGVVPQADGGYLVYLAVDDDDMSLADTVESVAARDPTVSRVRSLGGDGRFEVRLSASPLFGRAAAHGGTVRAVTADEDDCVVRIELPVSVDVRAFVDAFREEFPDMTVLAQRSPEGNASDVHAGAIEGLTDRQREVLEVAFHSGFFEWPRESTGEDVAAGLGIAPPTFHKHVRTAERKLLEALLGHPET